VSRRVFFMEEAMSDILCRITELEASIVHASTQWEYEMIDRELNELWHDYEVESVEHYLATRGEAG